MSFVVDFRGLWNNADYSRVRILDEGRQEDNSFVYKIEVLNGPLKDELDKLKGGNNE